MMNKQYGYFDKDTSDYHITEANLPRNWYNRKWCRLLPCCNYDTGAASWFLMTILEGLFGVKATTANDDLQQ